eukprot:498782-Hanusia_phi.AAC.1
MTWAACTGGPPSFRQGASHPSHHVLDLAERDSVSPAREQKRQDARRLNDEGVVMMSALQYDRAEHLLRNAMDLDPSYPPALCNFGRLLARRGGNLQAAGHMMRTAHELQPT